jgi:hypothetical protein
MIAGMEAAVASVIEDGLGEDETLEGVLWVVRTTTTRTDVPGDRSVIGVRVSSMERGHTQLADCIVEIAVMTPAVNENTSPSHHALLQAAVERIFSIGTTIDGDSVKEVLAAAIETTLDGWTGAGFFNQGWTPGQEGTDWLPVLNVKIGARRED